MQRVSARHLWRGSNVLPFLALGLLVGPATADADPATVGSVTTSSAQRAAALKLPFEKYSLDNGLEVILHRDSRLPLVAVSVWYHVGPVNEPPGRSGFAHLFEHLMFEGSRHVGNRFDTLLESAGATNVNGTTSWDRTNYFETVPREQLALALWIESDRMGYLLDHLTPGNLEKQRGIVLNERRQTYETEPYGPTTLRLFDTLFPPGHPYHGVVIGSVRDISAATMDDVRSFYTQFYAPSNATLALVGDIETDEAKGLVEKYFATLPRRAAPARIRTPTRAPSRAKRSVVEEPVDLGRVSMAWIVPPAYSAGDAALEVLSAALAGGRATELYRELVVTKRVASEVAAYLDSNELCGIFAVSATAASGVTETELEQATEAVLDRVANSGANEADLRRAKRRILVSLYDNLQRLNGDGGESGRAGILQRFNHYLGDPGFLPRYVAAIEAVSVNDLASVAKRYLGRDGRATVITRPVATRPEQQ
jgi:zinc protease